MSVVKVHNHACFYRVLLKQKQKNQTKQTNKKETKTNKKKKNTKHTHNQTMISAELFQKIMEDRFVEVMLRLILYEILQEGVTH